MQNISAFNFQRFSHGTYYFRSFLTGLIGWLVKLTSMNNAEHNKLLYVATNWASKLDLESASELFCTSCQSTSGNFIFHVQLEKAGDKTNTTKANCFALLCHSFAQGYQTGTVVTRHFPTDFSSCFCQPMKEWDQDKKGLNLNKGKGFAPKH